MGPQGYFFFFRYAHLIILWNLRIINVAIIILYAVPIIIAHIKLHGQRDRLR